MFPILTTQQSYTTLNILTFKYKELVHISFQYKYNLYKITTSWSRDWLF
jgi:hypothetical protein